MNRWIPLWSLILLISAVGCGDDTTDETVLAVLVESRDEIVSEDGVLELLSGELRLLSISLVDEGGTVPLIGPTNLDLSLDAQEIEISSPVEPGRYTGLLIELAPAAEGELMLDTVVRSASSGETIRAISELSLGGETSFSEGTRTIAEGSTVELRLSLRGMFFYLSPFTDAVDGVYDASENQRDFLSMDLVGMFDLRILP